MKSSMLAALAFSILSLASPLCERQTNACVLEGRRGDISTASPAWKRLPGIPTVEACLAECNKPEYSACKAFQFRDNGACILYTTDVSNAFTSKLSSTYTLYVLPAGIYGATPANKPAWYGAEGTKDKANYADCRSYCLSDAECKGFAFREGGNCRKFEVSLAGRVVPKTEPNLYTHYQTDCAVAAPPARVVESTLPQV